MDYSASTAASAAMVSPRIHGDREASALSRRRAELAVILPLLALVLVWTLIYPQSGDGDATLHFINARDALRQPNYLLGSWARIGVKAFMMLPAQWGLFPTRCVWLGITGVLAWQTIGLARDLNLRRPALAAALLMVQPFVFALASDTMTELPMALGLVIALRLWLSRRWWASVLVVGYLPTVRPEGFFFGVMWGLMVLATPGIGSLVRRLVVASTLAWGVAAWCIFCKLVCGNFLYVLHGGWSWPADSTSMYGTGGFFNYIDRWPAVCGPVVLVLFLAALTGLPHRRGIGMAAAGLLVLQFFVPRWFCEHALPYPALALIGWMAWDWRKEKMAPAWWALLLVVTLHTVLWWRGWFASCGLLRIMAVTSPVIAVLALRGWNILEQRFHPNRIVATSAVAVAIVYAMSAYAVDPYRQRIFGMHEACNYIRANHLMDDPAKLPAIAFGDPMAQIDLNLPANPKNILNFAFTHAQSCRVLLDAPIGTVGIWDNQHALQWFHVDPSEFEDLGYKVYWCPPRPVRPSWKWLMRQPDQMNDEIYIVVIKERPGTMTQLWRE